MNKYHMQWNAPERHVNIKATNEGEWFEKLKLTARKLGKGFTIGIVGKRGEGKTQFGVELMKVNAVVHKKSVYYITAAEFFMTLQTTFRKDSVQSTLEFVQELRRPKLLVIDEVGKRGETDWENNIFFELMNKRYGDMTDTLLISNHDSAHFAEAIGDSLMSRLNETGGVIDASWPSFRK